MDRRLPPTSLNPARRQVEGQRMYLFHKADFI